MRRFEDIVRAHPELQRMTPTSEDLAWISRGRRPAELIARACYRFHQRPFLTLNPGDPEGEVHTYGQFWCRVRRLISLLRDRGCTEGTMIGLCGFGCPDWAAAEVACLCLGATSVPLDGDLSADDLVAILDEMDLLVLLCESEPYEKLRARFVSRSRSVDSLVLFSACSSPTENQKSACSADLVKEDLDRGFAPVNPDQLFSVVYTSGSTGRPKGVMLTYGRWEQTLRDALHRTPAPRVTLGYLPLCHMAGRIDLFNTMMAGGVVHLVEAKNRGDLLGELQRARPTHLLLVPRLAGLLYQRFRDEMRRLGHSGPWDALLKQVAVRNACQDFHRSSLGGRLGNVTTGSAPTPLEVSQFLTEGLGLQVTDLYGSTEAGPIWTDGKVHAWVEYRLLDRPELGYTTKDQPHPRGELAVKSSRVTNGYYQNDEANSDLFHEGYLLTGDIVEERGSRQLKWLDRRSNVLRLAQGVFVQLSRLEATFLAGSGLIEQIFLYGSPWRSYLLAVVVPSPLLKASTEDPELRRDQLKAELARIGQQENLKPYEIPRDVLEAIEPFSPQNELLSAAGKPRHSKLKERYSGPLEELYRRLEREAQGAREHRTEGPFAQVLLQVLESIPSNFAEFSFVHLGGDSLGALQFAEQLWRDHGLKVTAADLLNPNLPLGELMRELKNDLGSILSRLHGQGNREAQASDFVRLLEHFAESSTPRTVPRPRAVLMTGSTGFLGRFTVLELAKKLGPEGEVTCLVRAKDTETALHRLQTSFRSPQGRQAFQSLQPRVRVLVGDLTRTQLGLSAEDYEDLSQRIDSIVHAGAMVNHALPYEQLVLPNVVGTAEIARFAAHGRPKAIHFVSTVAVGLGSRARGILRESDQAQDLWPSRPLEASTYAHGYVTTKWAGELLLEAFQRRTGLPVTILRSGLLLPAALWPKECNHSDALARLMAGVCKVRLVPSSHPDSTPINGLPGDLAGIFLARLACRETQGFKTLHLSYPLEGISVSTLFERATVLFDCEPKRTEEFWPSYRQRLMALGPEERSRSALSILDSWSQARTDTLMVENSRLCELWTLLGLAPMVLEEGYLDRCLATWSTLLDD